MMDKRIEFSVESVADSDFHEVVTLFALMGRNYSCDGHDDRTRDTFLKYVHGEQKRGLVARVGSQIVGVVLFEITPLLSRRHFQGRGDGLAVKPEMRGQGVGKALIRAAIKECKEFGVTSYLVKASAPEVISLYRSMPDLEERGVYFYAKLDS